MHDAVTEARAAIARGDLMLAYDVCITAIQSGADDPALYHQHVLAMARMGDTDNALRLFHEYGLDASTVVDHIAIGARLLKDKALATGDGAQRLQLLREAASAYADIFHDSRDSYPGINAASLALLAGDDMAARHLADEILALPEIAEPGDYYQAATGAEALIILGRVHDARGVLEQAVTLPYADSGAKSSTYGQLRLLLKQMGSDATVIKTTLAAVRPPEVMFFCGHIFRNDAAVEARLTAKVNALIDSHAIGIAYGALAAGADILIAEAVLAKGGELHVVMPFDQDDFIAQSVTPAGGDWQARFDACLAAATSVTFASTINYVGDPSQFQYSSHVAMGLVKLRARNLGVSGVQIAIWDGVASDGPAGAAADVAAWQAQGGETLIIDGNGLDRTVNRKEVAVDEVHDRALAAIIFSDFPGFSKLAEAALPAFWDGVMRHVAETLDDHGDAVLTRNSWGDALYAVADSASAAANIAVELQKRLSGFDYNRLGLANSAGMRIGIHYGPAYRITDLITGKPTFYGTEVSRAARIEPVTPPGAVFVTEPFAAILALENPDGFQCRYVGRVELAKGYGTFPMYRLTAN